MFAPRLDVYQDKCPTCNGTGKDPKKRYRKCPMCRGHKTVEFCRHCREVAPCSGTRVPGGPCEFITGIGRTH